MNKINHILFVDEAHVTEDDALVQAIELAQSQQAKLTVAGCFDNLKKLSENQPNTTLLIDDIKNQKQQELMQKVMPLARELDADFKVFSGKPFIDIIQEVVKHDIDMVIKNVEPSGIKSFLFGSQDLKILRMCPCPIWLIKSSEEGGEAVTQVGQKRIIVAIDYEPNNPENEWINKQLLDYGVSLALLQSAELHVVHCRVVSNENYLRGLRMQYSSKQVEDILEKVKQKRKDWLDKSVRDCLASHAESTQQHLSPQLHLIEGAAAAKIPELVDKLNAELLVMGTVGRTGIQGLLIGNTAESMLFNINCSVLAIKPEGFISPIKVS